MIGKLPKHSFFGAAIGTMVEYYDYSIFALFLPILSPLFFPAASAYESLAKGYLILLASMLARPLGGIVFGYIGDHFGRRKALLASMYGIAFSTIAIGLTPSSLSIGVIATIIILLLKVAQSFCFGGEYNGAGIYVVEHAQSKYELFVSSLLSCATLFGSLIGTLMGILITAKFMPDWGWRIAFIFGGVIGILGILSRKNLIESPQFQPADKDKDTFLTMLRLFPKELIAGFFLGASSTTAYVTIFTFINPVLMTKGYFTSQQLMMTQMIITVAAVISLAAIAYSCQRYSPRNVISIGCILIAIIISPLLLAVNNHYFLTYTFLACLMVMANECVFGPSSAYLKNLFPAHFRYRASAFSFCLGMSVFGGFTPIIENELYQYTGSFLSTAFWILFVTFATLISTRYLCRSKTTSILIEPSMAPNY